jgi:hypothetical protein
VAGRRRGRLTTATRGCGGGPARGCAREGKMLWTRGARVSKEDHRAAAEHVLRLGEARASRSWRSWQHAWRLGRRRRDMEMQELASARPGSGGAGAGWHMAWLRAARGRPVRGTWPARAATVGRRENRGGGSWR